MGVVFPETWILRLERQQSHPHQRAHLTRLWALPRVSDPGSLHGIREYDMAAILPGDIQGPCFETHTKSMYIRSVGVLQKKSTHHH